MSDTATLKFTAKTVSLYVAGEKIGPTRKINSETVAMLVREAHSRVGINNTMVSGSSFTFWLKGLRSVDEWVEGFNK